MADVIWTYPYGCEGSSAVGARVQKVQRVQRVEVGASKFLEGALLRKKLYKCRTSTGDNNLCLLHRRL